MPAAIMSLSSITAPSLKRIRHWRIGLLARDQRIPKPLRWLAGIRLLPIPGPFDEALLILLTPMLFHRGLMREAWTQAG